MRRLTVVGISQIIGFATAISAILTGLLGSVFSNDLKSSLQAVVSDDHAIPSFWGLFAITALLLILRQNLEERRSAKDHQDLQTSTNRIPFLIRVHPPISVMEKTGARLEKAFIQVRKYERFAAEAANLAKRNELLVTCVAEFILDSLVDELRDYSEGERRDKFGASFYIFCPAHSFSDVDWDKEPWCKSLHFLHGRKPDPEGALLLLPSVFQRLAGEESSLPRADFGLEIEERHLNHQRNSKFPPLFGAPRAAVDGHFQEVPSISKNSIAALLRESEIDGIRRENVERYFDQLRRAGRMSGFVSIPVYRPTPHLVRDKSIEDLVGVLNLEWLRSDRLGISEARKAFVSHIYPFRMLLGVLFERETDPFKLGRMTSMNGEDWLKQNQVDRLTISSSDERA